MSSKKKTPPHKPASNHQSNHQLSNQLPGISFFILAGGYGKRARPLSLVKPKPVFPLHRTPLIEILLRQLAEKGNTNFRNDHSDQNDPITSNWFKNGFVNLHYKPEQVRQCVANVSVPGLSIQFLYEDQLSGSKILREAQHHMGEFLFIMNGDVFLELPKISISQMHLHLVETGADGILLLRRNADPAYSAVQVEKDPRINNAGVGIFKGVTPHPGITGISETSGTPGTAPFMYTGTALFRKRVVEQMNDTSFFQTLAKNDFTVHTMEYSGMWFDLGNPRMYFDSNFRYKEEILKEEILKEERLKNNSDKNKSGNSISDGVHISSQSDVQHSILWENTRIEGKCTLRDCIVTGNLTLENVSYTRKIIYRSDPQGEILVTDL